MRSLRSPCRAARVSGLSAGRSPVFPRRDIMAKPEDLDISLDRMQLFPPGKPGNRAAVYVIGGTGIFDERNNEELENRTMALFGDEGDAVGVRALENGREVHVLLGKTAPRTGCLGRPHRDEHAGGTAPGLRRA